MLARGLKLLCPRCGEGTLFERGFRLRPRCPACWLRFEREQGYYLGAIYLNYGLTVAAVGTEALLLATLTDLGLGAQIGIAVAASIAAPLVFFRWSKGLWLAFDHLLDPD